jgi:hypothetical protein
MALYIETLSERGGFTVRLCRGYEVVERITFLTLDSANNYKHKLHNRYGDIAEMDLKVF